MPSSETSSLGLLVLQCLSVVGFLWALATGHFTDLDRQSRLPLDEGEVVTTQTAAPPRDEPPTIREASGR